MPRTFLAAIETESSRAGLAVIDLLKVTFPADIGIKYWANIPCTYDSHPYEARILSLGNWSRSMNAEVDALTITLGNADGEITKICNAVETELAEVELIRYFPDLDVAIDPLWVGWGGTMSYNEMDVSWEIHFGMRGFTADGLRKLSQTCWKGFADDLYCPYDGTTIGRSTALNESIDGTDTTFHCVSDGADYIEVADVLLIESEEMLVLSNSGGLLTVWRGYNGTLEASHAKDTKIYFNNCRKDRDSCIRKGMHGPPEIPTGKRYFGGWVSPLITGSNLPTGGGVYKNYDIFDTPIPAVYGMWRLTGVQCALGFDAREFKHMLYLLCEGPLSGMSFTDIWAGGPPDDQAPTGSTGFSSRTCDSILYYKGDIGQRSSHGLFSNIDTDTYLDNPHVFNELNGDGVSLDCIVALRLRIEEGGNEYDNNFPTLNVSIWGRNPKPISMLGGPNPISVAVDYLTNGRFGAKYDIDLISTVEALQEEDYCLQEIGPATFTSFNIAGIVLFGPTDAVPAYAPKGTNWVIATLDCSVMDGSLTGRTLRVDTPAKSQIVTILHNYSVESLDPSRWAGASNIIGLTELWTPDFASSFQVIEIGVGIEADTWETGKVPSVDNTFTIMAYNENGEIPRFVFNGMLSGDDSVEKNLAAILANCNGYYISRGNKIVFGIRKAVDLNAVDALPTLTDYGADRNIIREDGVSSLRVEHLSAVDGIPNQIDVKYFDAENNFAESTLSVYDEDLQFLRGKIIAGDTTRTINSKELRLIGTIHKDQAARLGALAIREAAMQRDKYIFKMSLKDSLSLEPGDVRRLDSLSVASDVDKKLSGQGAGDRYIRIAKIREFDKFTAEIEAWRHENGAYDDTTVNLVSANLLMKPENTQNYPANVVPDDPVEEVEYGQDGTVLSVVTVGITYPYVSSASPSPSPSASLSPSTSVSPSPS